MNEEMDSLSENETWDLVPSSSNHKAIGCKWIYKVKYNTDGLQSWLISFPSLKPSLVKMKKKIFVLIWCSYMEFHMI